MTSDILEKSGWFEGRIADLSRLERFAARFGYFISQESLSFLMEYGGLDFRKECEDFNQQVTFFGNSKIPFYFPFCCSKDSKKQSNIVNKFFGYVVSQPVCFVGFYKLRSRLENIRRPIFFSDDASVFLFAEPEGGLLAFKNGIELLFQMEKMSDSLLCANEFYYSLESTDDTAAELACDITLEGMLYSD